MFEFAGGVEGHVGDGGEDDGVVFHVAEGEGSGIDLSFHGEHSVVPCVGVEAGGEDGAEFGAVAGEGGVHGGEVGGGFGPDVGVGEVESDVGDGSAFAEELAVACDVGGDVGHGDVPGVFVVHDGGGVEAPAGVGGTVAGVGPAVADDLIDAIEEVGIDFFLHIEWGGAEGGSVEPGEGFGGGDGDVHEVSGGGGVAGGAEVVEVEFGLEFAFGEVGGGVAEEGGGGGSVGLDAEAGVVLVGKCFEVGAEIFVEEFGDGLAVVVADVVGAIADVAVESGEVGSEVIAAAFLELSEEVGGPVFAVDFEAVAEDGVGGIVGAGFDFGLGDFVDEFVDDGGAEVVDDVSLGTEGGAFDLHAGAAGDEENDIAAGEVGWELCGVVGDGDEFEGRGVGGAASPPPPPPPDAAGPANAAMMVWPGFRSGKGMEVSPALAEMVWVSMRPAPSSAVNMGPP